jgi:hypothetical protein
MSTSRITRLDLARIESPTFEGRTFGDVGPYEKLIGRAYGEVDPADPRNRVIADLDLAPRNAAGRVEYATDIIILRPVDPARGNHRLFYALTNRGNVVSLAQLNDAPSGGNEPAAAADAGNGFLMRQGFTIVFTGWDATAPAGGGRLTMTAPVAQQPDGTPITGPALEEFAVNDDPLLIGPLTYPAATAGKSQASLTVRVRVEDRPEPVPATSWDYTDATHRAIKLLPNGTPFQPGRLYEFTYIAKDPIVAGLGFAAVRDIATFLHHSTVDDYGTANPLAGDVQAVYAFGVSQPSRMLRDFLWLGFNQDGTGRRVFDGVLNWIGGPGGIFMNYRFAQPGRTHRQHINRWYPELQFPFAYQLLTDPVTGKTDGRLRRCQASDTCPQIIEVNSANEYWAKANALQHLDSEGNDLPDPPNVRSFFLASLPHGCGSGPTGRGICQHECNPLVANPVLRALLVALDQWVSWGIEPPASRLPRRANGTLAPPLLQEGAGFPSIPGVVYTGRVHTGDLLDFGPRFEQGILTVVPPRVLGSPYPALVPTTDADGNDRAGVRLPEVAVPVATYTGWGLRAVPPGANEGCDHFGQKVAFAQTRTQRLAAGDPRLSIEERYPTHGAYVSAVTAAAEALQQQRLLLEEDAQAHVEAAVRSTVGLQVATTVQRPTGQ